MSKPKPLKETSIIRYFDTYIRLRANNITLSEASKMSESKFRKATGRGIGDLKLARSLAKNDYAQKSVNDYIRRKKLQSVLIKPIEIKDYTQHPEKPITTIKEIPLLKEGSYGIAEIIDEKGNRYWIKYTNEKEYKKQLNKIKAHYPKIKRIKFHESKPYKAFIDKEFRKEMAKAGISL